ncbi:MAG: helix-turn-helix transcriptional regulator [Leptolyngbya sp. SIO4C5]|nr:helix-turn-helix transcriptional regulator [Leptolyngbya sp. SIO4C5]
MITLTDTKLEDLIKEAAQQGELMHPPVELGLRTNFPRALGQGSEYVVDLRGALSVWIVKVRPWETVQFERFHEDRFPLTAKFYLSGSSRIYTPGVTDIATDYEEVAGCSYLYHLPNQTEVEECAPNELVHVVLVFADINYFNRLDLSSMTLPKPLQKLLEGDTTQRFHQPLGKIIPAMQQVLRQILCSPYQGVMQQLFLESKALELFTLQFAHWADYLHSPSTLSTKLSSDDIERLYYARTILLDRFDNPPSLLELAQQTSLNEHKLKQGFRQLFKTTVFGCLYDYRMQQARHLLLNSNLSIAGVASRVGYHNPEAFSTAFRRRFAVNPKSYQLGKYHEGG